MFRLKLTNNIPATILQNKLFPEGKNVDKPSCKNKTYVGFNSSRKNNSKSHQQQVFGFWFFFTKLLRLTCDLELQKMESKNLM